MQKPQLSGSFVMSVQAMPHAISFVGHVATQVFCEQNGVAPAQIVPQAPQFIGSESTFAHLSPHARSGAAHEQVLFEHTCGDVHCLRHTPQLLPSVRVSVHTVETPMFAVGGTGQLTWPFAHMGAPKVPLVPPLPPAPAPDLPAEALVPPLPC